MICPICKSKGHVEIDLHADGFAQDACECGDCGSIWTYRGEDLKIIKGRVSQKVTAYSDFICQTCKAILCIETDLDAFQFHEELQECSPGRSCQGLTGELFPEHDLGPRGVGRLRLCLILAKAEDDSWKIYGAYRMPA